MPRTPVNVAGARLKQLMTRMAVVVAQAAASDAIDVVHNSAIEELSGEAREVLFQEFRIAAIDMVGSAFADGFRQMGEQAANNLTKAADAIMEATVGLEGRDNEEISAAMQALSDRINEEILEAYLEDFGGRSYRIGDDSRKSGNLESFLQRRLLSKADGMEVQISLAPAINNPDVPHLLRLNYGTKAHPEAKGGEKYGNRPPTFSISFVPGAPSVTKQLDGPRRPAFMYPGKVGNSFPYRIAIGGAGEVQVHYAQQNAQGGGAALIGPKPSRGIGPSYFVEYGISRAADTLPREFRTLINRWKRRVARVNKY